MGPGLNFAARGSMPQTSLGIETCNKKLHESDMGQAMMGLILFSKAATASTGFVLLEDHPFEAEDCGQPPDSAGDQASSFACRGVSSITSFLSKAGRGLQSSGAGVLPYCLTWRPRQNISSCHYRTFRRCQCHSFLYFFVTISSCARTTCSEYAASFISRHPFYNITLATAVPCMKFSM